MARKMLHLALLASALATGALPTVAASHSPPTAPVQNVRPTMVLAQGWRFSLAPAASDPEKPAFDDSAWSSVSVPHTWNRVGLYLAEPATHINRPGDINKTMGIGWYRLRFQPSAAFAGRRAWLQFDAASRIAEVWLNGIRLGTHQGGFSRFRFDATAALRTDGSNVLAVKVDNSKPELGSATADVLPLSGDFFVYGGLYRPVSLIGTGAIHLTMLDHGGSGVRAVTASIAGNQAAVRVRATVSNVGRFDQAVLVRAKLVDKAGNVAGEETQRLRALPNAGTAFDRTLHLNAAHLWNGVTDPYLYSLVVEVRDRRGNLADRVTQAFGIRQIRIDPALGFLLNGHAYPLHGVGYHQDREGKGWAISTQDVENDFASLREMGANTIRLTHYQHGQTVHDLADRYGFVLWDEIPLVSQWTLGGSKVASPGLVANARQQLTEEIAQDGNHASVAVWSIANEVDFGNSLPAFLTGSTGTPPDPAPLLHELDSLAHDLDPSRLSTLATCCEGRLFAQGVDVPITATQVDVAGANRYFGWYYGKSAELGPSLDALHARRPAQPLAVTEYGAGGAIDIHTDNPEAAPPDSRGRKQPEEVESLIHEQNRAQLATRGYLWATWLWSAFDFASTVRHEGNADDINTKGLVTFDHATRKDAFWFYKANWSAVPTVHVTGGHYVNRAFQVTDVRVYSNAPTTVLTVNGRVIGKRNQCENKVCVWKAVRLDAGNNIVEARGGFPDRVVLDHVTWQLDPSRVDSYYIDAGALVAPKAGTPTFGSDNFFTGGEAGSVDKPADYGKPESPTPIAGSNMRDVAATFRRGTFEYDLPVRNGHYTVKLTFVEPSEAAGERVFDVAANGALAIQSLDVAKAAGGPLNALLRSFDVDVTDGMLRLAFRPGRGTAIVSSIEVTPA